MGVGLAYNAAMTTTRILLVDDDTALLQALPEAVRLRMPQIEVDTCDTALDALERIRLTDYDSIVSDIKMPEMDGLTLMERIKTVRPHTPTILISGHMQHDLAVTALRNGAYAYIQKPIDRDFFVAWLVRAIEVRRLNRQVEEQRVALEQHASNLEGVVEERTRELREEIVERRRAEARLQEESAFRKAIEDATPAGVAAIDLEGRQSYVNPAFCRLVGWDEADLIDKRPPFPYWPPEEVETIQRSIDMTLRSEAPAAGFELRFQRRNGERFDVLVRITSIMDGSRVSGWLATMLDISRRKKAERSLSESEAQLRFTLDAAQIGTWDWNMETGLVRWSETFARIHGRDAGILEGTFDSFYSDAHPEDLEKLQVSIQTAIEGNGECHVEYRLAPQNGHVICVQGKGRVIYDEHHRPVRMIGICMDVTARNQGAEPPRRREGTVLIRADLTRSGSDAPFR